MWRIWKYSLGSFNDETTKEYDNYVVLVRSIIFFSYLITNCFIISGVIRHWGSVPVKQPAHGALCGVKNGVLLKSQTNTSTNDNSINTRPR